MCSMMGTDLSLKSMRVSVVCTTVAPPSASNANREPLFLGVRKGGSANSSSPPFLRDDSTSCAIGIAASEAYSTSQAKMTSKAEANAGGGAAQSSCIVRQTPWPGASGDADTKGAEFEIVRSPLLEQVASAQCKAHGERSASSTLLAPARAAAAPASPTPHPRSRTCFEANSRGSKKIARAAATALGHKVAQ